MKFGAVVGSLLYLSVCPAPCGALSSVTGGGAAPFAWAAASVGRCAGGAQRYQRLASPLPPRECVLTDVAALVPSIPGQLVLGFEVDAAPASAASAAQACVILIDPAADIRRATQIAGWHFIEDEDSLTQGDSPLDGGLWCLPAGSCGVAQAEDCAGTSFSGKNPERGCEQLPCPELPDVKSDAATTESPHTHDAQHPFYPGFSPRICSCKPETTEVSVDEFDRLEWYCAHLDDVGRCAAMQKFVSSERHVGFCPEGWIECPGYKYVPLLDPPDAGSRCGCTDYLRGASSGDSYLCREPDRHLDAQMCFPPHRRKMCPREAIPCRAPRILAVSLTRAVDAGDPLTWEADIKCNLSVVMGVRQTALEIVWICPAEVCLGGCPLWPEDRRRHGCAQKLHDLAVDTHLVQPLSLEIEVHLDGNNQRSWAIAELISVKKFRSPLMQYTVLRETGVDSVRLVPVPPSKTAPEDRMRTPEDHSWLAVSASGLFAVCVLATGLAIVKREKRAAAHETEGVLALAERLMANQAIELQDVSRPQTNYACCQPSIPSTPYQTTVHDEIRASHYQQLSRRVDEWRTARTVPPPPDRDANLPLGESTGVSDSLDAPWWGGEIFVDSFARSRTSSSEAEMTI